MMPDDFKPGDRVIYIPRHAHGDSHHPDAEQGVVTSIGTDEGQGVVFVRFKGTHGIACAPDSLWHDDGLGGSRER